MSIPLFLFSSSSFSTSVLTFVFSFSIVFLAEQAEPTRRGYLASWPMVGSVGGFVLGYTAGRLWLDNERASRTVAIEVGMQNSGLGVVLAQQNFVNPLVALPCALAVASVAPSGLQAMSLT